MKRKKQFKIDPGGPFPELAPYVQCSGLWLFCYGGMLWLHQPRPSVRCAVTVVDSGREPQAAQQRLRHGAGLAGEASDMTG